MSNFIDSGERVEGTDGLRIFFRSLRPAEKPRAVVVIVPGFNAHSGYYAWVAEQLVATGVAVYAVDLRGRGNSDGDRFYIETFHWERKPGYMTLSSEQYQHFRLAEWPA